MAKENLAYDLSLFEPREERQPREKKLKVIKQQNVKRVNITTVLKSVTVSLFVIMSLAAVMINNVRLTELNDKLTAAQKRLSNAQSEKVRLDMLVESRMSLKNVENYAISNLGMQKVQSSQIQYINIDNSDSVVINRQSVSGPYSFLQKIAANLVEYFK